MHCSRKRHKAELKPCIRCARCLNSERDDLDAITIESFCAIVVLSRDRSLYIGLRRHNTIQDVPVTMHCGFTSLEMRLMLVKDVPWESDQSITRKAIRGNRDTPVANCRNVSQHSCTSAHFGIALLASR